MQHLSEGFKWLGVITTVISALWFLTKPHAEGFVKKTVQDKFEFVERGLSEVQNKQAVQERTQVRIEEKLEGLSHIQEDMRRDLKELVGKRRTR